MELYLILALSLNLLVGYAGLVSLCHAAFYGVGAYATALLMRNLGWSLAPAVATAVIVTMLLGLIVALPSLRLRGDYFVVATLACQTITYRALYNLDHVTGGARGLTGIPPARVFGHDAGPDTVEFLVLHTVVTAVCVVVLVRLLRSPFGRVLRAVRDDEVAVESLGRAPAVHKVKAFLVGSACAAVAGALLAVRIGTLDPNQFAIAESVTILTALIVGGSGNTIGPAVGAVAVVLLPEPLRFISGWSAWVGEIRQIVFGLLLIALLRWRPQGLAGEYRFE